MKNLWIAVAETPSMAQEFLARNRVKLERDREGKERDRGWSMEEVCPRLPQLDETRNEGKKDFE
jgi:hypothetical protein